MANVPVPQISDVGSLERTTSASAIFPNVQGALTCFLSRLARFSDVGPVSRSMVAANFSQPLRLKMRLQGAPTEVEQACSKAVNTLKPESYFGCRLASECFRT